MVGLSAASAGGSGMTMVSRSDGSSTAEMPPPCGRSKMTKPVVAGTSLSLSGPGAVTAWLAPPGEVQATGIIAANPINRINMIVTTRIERWRASTCDDIILLLIERLERAGRCWVQLEPRGESTAARVNGVSQM